MAANIVSHDVEKIVSPETSSEVEAVLLQRALIADLEQQEAYARLPDPPAWL